MCTSSTVSHVFSFLLFIKPLTAVIGERKSLTSSSCARRHRWWFEASCHEAWAEVGGGVAWFYINMWVKKSQRASYVWDEPLNKALELMQMVMRCSFNLKGYSDSFEGCLYTSVSFCRQGRCCFPVPWHLKSVLFDLRNVGERYHITRSLAGYDI